MVDGLLTYILCYFELYSYHVSHDIMMDGGCQKKLILMLMSYIHASKRVFPGTFSDLSKFQRHDRDNLINRTLFSTLKVARLLKLTTSQTKSYRVTLLRVVYLLITFSLTKYSNSQSNFNKYCDILNQDVSILMLDT